MRCQQVNCTPTSAGIFNITRAPDEVQSTGGSNKNFGTCALGNVKIKYNISLYFAQNTQNDCRSPKIL